MIKDKGRKLNYAFIRAHLLKDELTFFMKAFKAIKNPKKIYYKLLWTYYTYKLNTLFAKHFINRKKNRNTIILTSYPRSGNTFFRFVWFNIISLIELKGKEIDFEILDNYMPFEGFFNDLKEDWHFKTLPRLLKSHRQYSNIYKNFKAIHLFRNPLDTMVSSYYYFSARIKGPEGVNFSWIENKIYNLPNNQFKGSFSEFLFKNFDAYCDHFISWIKSSAVPASYETLISKDSYCSFARIFKALGLYVEDDVLDNAIKLSLKGTIKDKSPSKKMAKLSGMNFVRDGTVGQWKNYYGEKELEFVLERLSFYGLDKINTFPEEYRSLLIDWPLKSL